MKKQKSARYAPADYTSCKSARYTAAGLLVLILVGIPLLLVTTCGSKPRLTGKGKPLATSAEIARAEKKAEQAQTPTEEAPMAPRPGIDEPAVNPCHVPWSTSYGFVSLGLIPLAFLALALVGLKAGGVGCFVGLGLFFWWTSVQVGKFGFDQAIGGMMAYFFIIAVICVVFNLGVLMLKGFGR